MFIVQYNKDNSSLWGKVWAGLLVAYNKRFGLSPLRVPLLCCNPLHVQASSGPDWVTLWETGFREMVQENANPLSTAVTLSNTLIFVSEPGVSCLLLASWGIRQAHLLACKLGEISEPSQFLTEMREKVRQGRKGNQSRCVNERAPSVGS